MYINIKASVFDKIFVYNITGYEILFLFLALFTFMFISSKILKEIKKKPARGKKILLSSSFIGSYLIFVLIFKILGH